MRVNLELPICSHPVSNTRTILAICPGREQDAVAPSRYALFKFLVRANSTRLELVRRGEGDGPLAEVVQRAPEILLLAELVVREERGEVVLDFVCNKAQCERFGRLGTDPVVEISARGGDGRLAGRCAKGTALACWSAPEEEDCRQITGSASLLSTPSDDTCGKTCRRSESHVRRTTRPERAS